MRVGQLIKSLRQERGMRSGDLAEAVGVSRSYISRIENEDRKLSTSIILRIAEALSVDPALLTAEAKQDPVDLRLRKAVELLLAGRVLNPRFVGNLFSFLSSDPCHLREVRAWGEGVVSCCRTLADRLRAGTDSEGWTYGERRDWVRNHLVEFVEHLAFFETVLEEALFLEGRDGDEEQPQGPSIPVLASGDDLAEGRAAQPLDVFGDLAAERLCAFQVQDNAMSPVYEPGCVVVFSTDRAAKAGDRVVACLTNGKLICKVLRRRGDMVQLVSQNPIYEPLFLDEEEIRWMHPVVRSVSA